MMRHGLAIALLARYPTRTTVQRLQFPVITRIDAPSQTLFSTGYRQRWHNEARPRHNSYTRSSSRPRPSPSLVHRSISTRPLPHQRGPIFRFCYRFLAYSGAFILVLTGCVGAFFIYDATTYREDLSYTDIPVSAEALNPRRGGPKNLPIAEVLVDDDDTEDNTRKKYKPKLVVLGSGWGSVALLKQLNPEDFHVTVVSPCNYFLFTPMLPSATVGTLELRSLIEPIRRIVQRVKGHFLRAEAVEVELSEQLLEVAQKDASGVKRHFYLPYDKLVIGVGKVFFSRDDYSACLPI